MIDMTSALTDSLHTAAGDDDVHVEELLAGARRAGVRYRRRRRVATLAGAVLSVALAAGAAAAVRPLWTAQPDRVVAASSGPPAPSAAATPTSPASPAPAMTAMPPLPAAPAQTAPVDVGGDPLLVHVWLAALPFPATSVQLVTGGGQESLRIDGRPGADGFAPGYLVQVGHQQSDLDALGGTKQDVTVAGHAAVAAVDSAGKRPFSAVRWRVATNLWVQVSGAMDRAATVSFAAEVRLDQVHRCAAPFRLSSTPAGARVSSCNVQFIDGAVVPTVSVRVAAWSVTVDLMPGHVRDANDTLGGSPAKVSEHSGDGGGRIMEVSVDRGDFVAHLTAEGPYDAAAVRAIAAGIVPAGGPNPADWPVNPLS